MHCRSSGRDILFSETPSLFDVSRDTATYSLVGGFCWWETHLLPIKSGHAPSGHSIAQSAPLFFTPNAKWYISRWKIMFIDNTTF